MSKINETNYPRRTQANYADTDMLVLQAAGGNTYTTRMEDMRDDYEATLAPAIEEAVGWVGSNLLDGVESASSGGITATKQNDGKYLVTGTRNGGTVVDLGHFLCKAGVEYKLSGCPTGGDSGNNDFWLAAYPLDSTSPVYARDGGTGATISAFNVDTEIRISIRIPSGYVCPSNFLWSPMISRNGGAYVPYHPTVQEELWDGEVSEPKNVLPPNVNSVSTGLTYAFNDDGSITIVKAATSSAALQLRMLVPSTVSGNYYFWACPNIGTQNIDAYMWDSTTGARCKKWDGTTASESDYYGIPQEVQIVSGHTTLLQIRLAANYTTPAGGITFKPMISVNGGAYSPYYVPLKDSMFRRSEQAVLGAKNFLCNYAPATTTSNGITWTRDENGVITANGTTTDASYCELWSQNPKVYEGYKNVLDLSQTYILNGNSQIWSDEWYVTLFMRVHLTDNSDKYFFDNGNGVVINLSQFNNIEFITMYCRVGYSQHGAQTVSNYKIRPMLRLASDPDDTYAPYAETNLELTQGKFNTSNVAPTEDGAGVSKAYSTGQYLIHGGELRKATTAIASGAEITDNNTGLATVGGELEQLNSDLASLKTNYVDIALKSVAVTNTDNGGYYGSVNITSDIPSGARPYSAIYVNSYIGGAALDVVSSTGDTVFTLVVHSSKSFTFSASSTAKARVYYFA